MCPWGIPLFTSPPHSSPTTAAPVLLIRTAVLPAGSASSERPSNFLRGCHLPHFPARGRREKRVCLSPEIRPARAASQTWGLPFSSWLCLATSVPKRPSPFLRPKRTVKNSPGEPPSSGFDCMVDWAGDQAGLYGMRTVCLVLEQLPRTQGLEDLSAYI